jgi:hypothetical protein
MYPDPWSTVFCKALTPLGLCAFLHHIIKNHSPRYQFSISCHSLAKASHVRFLKSSSKLWRSHNVCFIKTLMSSQFWTRILDYSKPNLNLQKGPLTLLVLALTQITTLIVRNNALLYCQLFWNQQFKETVPKNDLNEVYIKERKFRTEGLSFFLITFFYI